MYVLVDNVGEVCIESDARRQVFDKTKQFFLWIFIFSIGHTGSDWQCLWFDSHLVGVWG